MDPVVVILTVSVAVLSLAVAYLVFAHFFSNPVNDKDMMGTMYKMVMDINHRIEDLSSQGASIEELLEDFENAGGTCRCGCDDDYDMSDEVDGYEDSGNSSLEDYIEAQKDRDSIVDEISRDVFEGVSANISVLVGSAEENIRSMCEGVSESLRELSNSIDVKNHERSVEVNKFESITLEEVKDTVSEEVASAVKVIDEAMLTRTAAVLEAVEAVMSTLTKSQGLKTVQAKATSDRLTKSIEGIAFDIEGIKSMISDLNFPVLDSNEFANSFKELTEEQQKSIDSILEGLVEKIDKTVSSVVPAPQQPAPEKPKRVSLTSRTNKGQAPTIKTQPILGKRSYVRGGDSTVEENVAEGGPAEVCTPEDEAAKVSLKQISEKLAKFNGTVNVVDDSSEEILVSKDVEFTQVTPDENSIVEAVYPQTGDTPYVKAIGDLVNVVNVVDKLRPDMEIWNDPGASALKLFMEDTDSKHIIRQAREASILIMETSEGVLPSTKLIVAMLDMDAFNNETLSQVNNILKLYAKTVTYNMTEDEINNRKPELQAYFDSIMLGDYYDDDKVNA